MMRADPSATDSSPVHRADGWDAAVADYEALAEPFTRQFAVEALRLAGGAAAGTRVLDVACGTGALTLLLGQAGASALGVDFAPGMVGRLKARLAAEGLDRCSAEVMDGQALALPDAAFDAAFSLFGVMLFPEPARGLAEMVRVTRPGGLVAISAWANPVGAGPAVMLVEAFRLCFPDRMLPEWPPGLRRWSDGGALTGDLSAAGLADVALHRATGVWTAESADGVADAADRLFRQFPLWSALSAEERERLREELRGLLRARHPGEVREQSQAHVALGVRPGAA